MKSGANRSLNFFRIPLSPSPYKIRLADGGYHKSQQEWTEKPLRYGPSQAALQLVFHGGMKEGGKAGGEGEEAEEEGIDGIERRFPGLGLHQHLV